MTTPQQAVTEICKLYGHAPRAGADAILEVILDVINVPCQHQWQWTLPTGEIWGEPLILSAYDPNLIRGKCVMCGAVHWPEVHPKEMRGHERMG